MVCCPFVVSVIKFWSAVGGDGDGLLNLASDCQLHVGGDDFLF